MAIGRPDRATGQRSRPDLSTASIVDELDRQSGCLRPSYHILQLLQGGYLENHLGLSVPQPGSKVILAEVGEHGSDSSVSHLSSDLAASQAKIGPDDHRQLHFHEDTVRRR